MTLKSNISPVRDSVSEDVLMPRAIFQHIMELKQFFTIFFRRSCKAHSDDDIPHQLLIAQVVRRDSFGATTNKIGNKIME